MDFTLVRLDSLAKEEVLEFWRHKNDLYGQTLNFTEAAVNRKYTSHFETGKHKYLMYGILSPENKLVFTLGAVLWENLPYYSFIDFYSAPEIRKQNQVVKFMTLAIGQIMIEMFQAKRHTFYYIFKRDHVSPEVEWGDDRIHSCYKHFPESHKYDFTTELIIPAGERPPYLTYWKLMGERTHNVELAVRRGCLKPQYMKELLAASSNSATTYSGLNSESNW